MTKREAFDVSKFPVPPSGGSWGLPPDPLLGKMIFKSNHWRKNTSWQINPKRKKGAHKSERA